MTNLVSCVIFFQKPVVFFLDFHGNGHDRLNIFLSSLFILLLCFVSHPFTLRSHIQTNIIAQEERTRPYVGEQDRREEKIFTSLSSSPSHPVCVFMRAEIVFAVEMKVIARDAVIIHNDFSQQAPGCPCHSEETHAETESQKMTENGFNYFASILSVCGVRIKALREEPPFTSLFFRKNREPKAFFHLESSVIPS